MSSPRRAVCFVLLAVAGGCGRPQRATPLDPEANHPVRVVATTGMVADMVRGVAGDRVRVDQLMHAGVDPHLYKPTRDDVRALSDADAVFYSGLMLEGRMTDVLRSIGRSKPVVAVTANLTAEELISHPGSAGHPDPHVWMDVAAWAGCADVVAGALAGIDPGGKDEFVENARALRERLAGLHDYAKEALATIPEASRTLVTSHDAFSYFGRAYGLRVEGVQGISTESEAGLRRVNDLVTLLVEADVRAVFVESSVPQKALLALVEGARARGADIRIGGELYSDAMGPSGTYEGTYIGMIDHNVTVVTRALGGVAPERGWNGKLGAPPTAPTGAPATDLKVAP